MATVQTATSTKLVSVLVMVVMRRRLSSSSRDSAASSRFRSRRTAERAIHETTSAMIRMIPMRTPALFHQSAEKMPSVAASRLGGEAGAVESMARLNLRKREGPGKHRPAWRRGGAPG